MFHRFANPARFLRLAAAVQPWAGGATVVLLATGLFLGLVASPADYQQGETVRIMYVHVPSAWMAIFCYSALAGACAVALIWKHPLAGLAARATAPIGAAFTFLALVTGSLWGKPMWGDLVGVGRAPDQRAGAIFPLSRLYGARQRLR